MSMQFEKDTVLLKFSTSAEPKKLKALCVKGKFILSPKIDNQCHTAFSFFPLLN